MQREHSQDYVKSPNDGSGLRLNNVTNSRLIAKENADRKIGEVSNWKGRRYVPDTPLVQFIYENYEKYAVNAWLYKGTYTYERWKVQHMFSV